MAIQHRPRHSPKRPWRVTVKHLQLPKHLYIDSFATLEEALAAEDAYYAKRGGRKPLGRAAHRRRKWAAT